MNNKQSGCTESHTDSHFRVLSHLKCFMLIFSSWDANQLEHEHTHTRVQNQNASICHLSWFKS